MYLYNKLKSIPCYLWRSREWSSKDDIFLIWQWQHLTTSGKNLFFAIFDCFWTQKSYFNFSWGFQVRIYATKRTIIWGIYVLPIESSYFNSYIEGYRTNLFCFFTNHKCRTKFFICLTNPVTGVYMYCISQYSGYVKT